MFVENIYQGKAFTRGPMSDDGHIRMSLAGHCRRKEGYYLLGYDVDSDSRGQDLDDVMAARAADGHLHEAAMISELVSLGYTVWNTGSNQATTFFRDERALGLRFRGHPDVFTTIVNEEGKPENVLIELKGYRQEIFQLFVHQSVEVKPGKFIIPYSDNLRLELYDLIPQIQMYLHSEEAERLDIRRCFLLMKNKNTAEVAECCVWKNTEEVQEITRRWIGFWGYIQAQRLPPRPYADTSKECNFCPFSEQCWGFLKPLSKKKRTLTVGDLDEKSLNLVQKATILRRRGKEGEDRSKTDNQLARQVFVQELLKYEASSITIDGLTVNLNWRTRNAIDTERVKLFLEELLESEYIDQDKHDSFWSDTEYPEVRYQDRTLKE